MVTCAVFLRLNSLLKLAVLLLAVAVYAYLIHLAFLALARADVLHRSVRPLLAGSPLLELNFMNWIPLSDKCANTLLSCQDNQTKTIFSAYIICMLEMLFSHPSIPPLSM